MKRLIYFFVSFSILAMSTLIFTACGDGAGTDPGDIPPNSVKLNAVGNGAIVYNMTFSGDSSSRPMSRASLNYDGLEFEVIVYNPNSNKYSVHKGGVNVDNNDPKTYYALLKDAGGNEIGTFEITFNDAGELFLLDYDGNALPVGDEEIEALDVPGPLHQVNRIQGIEGTWRETTNYDDFPGHHTVGMADQYLVFNNGDSFSNRQIGHGIYVKYDENGKIIAESKNMYMDDMGTPMDRMKDSVGKGSYTLFNDAPGVVRISDVQKWSYVQEEHLPPDEDLTEEFLYYIEGNTLIWTTLPGPYDDPELLPILQEYDFSLKRMMDETDFIEMWQTFERVVLPTP